MAGNSGWLMDSAPQVSLNNPLDDLDVDLIKCPPQDWLHYLIFQDLLVLLIELLSLDNFSFN